MRDPWRFVAFTLAAMSGFIASDIVTRISTGNYGVPDLPGNLLLVGLLGLFTGFLVDELLPAYIDKVRGSSGAAGGDFDSGGGGDDFDFD